MKHKIGWHGWRPDEPVSAFASKPSVRPLRLTFHSESLRDVEADEAEALALLREFSLLPEIQSIYTSAGMFPFMVLEHPDQDILPFSVEYEDKEQWRDCLVWHYRPWEQEARDSVTTEIDSENQFPDRLRDILLAQAHCSLRHDLFVTTSSYLIQMRTKSLCCDANSMLPSEAIRVVCLYLRFREEYVIETFKSGGRSRYDRGLFYWLLMRHRLPAMWKYFSACVGADSAKKHTAMGLGSSIMPSVVSQKQRDRRV
jgi:hypothetical protein